MNSELTDKSRLDLL